MADGRSRLEWSIASCQMALMANCHRDPKRGRSFEPRDFDPYCRRTTMFHDSKAAFKAMKDLWGKQIKGKRRMT